MRNEAAQHSSNLAVSGSRGIGGVTIDGSNVIDLYDLEEDEEDDEEMEEDEGE